MKNLILEKLQTVDETSVKVTEHQSVHIGLKSVNATVYLDLRKWFLFENNGEERPSLKGIMLSVDNWRKVLPEIEKMIEKYDLTKEMPAGTSYEGVQLPGENDGSNKEANGGSIKGD